MSKRFTDTEKWKKAWYRELGPALRDLRQYLLDSCDHAGVWEVDLATARHFTGSAVSLDDVQAAFRGRAVPVGPDKLFFPDFVEFQYGELSEESKPHKSVITRLKSLGLFERYSKGIHTFKDKDKDKEQDKEEALALFEEIYSEYPKRKGTQRKKTALASFSKNFRQPERRERLIRAVRAYRAECIADKKLGTPYVMQVATFLGGPWEEYAERTEQQTKLRTFDEIQAERKASSA